MKIILAYKTDRTHFSIFYLKFNKHINFIPKTKSINVNKNNKQKHKVLVCVFIHKTHAIYVQEEWILAVLKTVILCF